MRLLARVFLERGGFNVVDEAEDGPQALERFQDLNPPPIPSVVLLDNRMPGLTGLEVAEQMLARHPSQVIVLFSAHLDDCGQGEGTRHRHRRMRLEDGGVSTSGDHPDAAAAGVTHRPTAHALRLPIPLSLAFYIPLLPPPLLFQSPVADTASLLAPRETTRRSGRFRQKAAQRASTRTWPGPRTEPDRISHVGLGHHGPVVGGQWRGVPAAGVERRVHPPVDVAPLGSM